MAKQQILWTVLPHGRQGDGPHGGKWRVSIVVSPRLTPEQADEQRVGAFDDWRDWPATLAQVEWALDIAGSTVALQVVTPAGLAPDAALWRQLVPESLPVAGFQFLDVSRVNLRSWPVRNVLGFVRRHYTSLSAQATAEHPVLLPWRQADPALKGMLAEAGTRTRGIALGERKIELPEPGFGRFHERGDDGSRGRHERLVDAAVFNEQSCVKAPVRIPGRGEPRTGRFPLRALPPDWEDPALIESGAIDVPAADRARRAQLMRQFSGPTEYALWQGDRFYRRTVATAAQLAQRRPDLAGGRPPLAAPEFDFHQRLASWGDHPNLLRRLGLVIDCVLEDGAPLDALLQGQDSALGTMRLRMRRAPPGVQAASVLPASAWAIQGKRFFMRPRTDDHAGGLLRLERADDRYAGGDPRERSPFDVFQLDPDGAALKTINFTLTAQNLVARNLELGADGKVTYTTGDRQPVAALRSGGLGVSRHGRAGQVGMAAADAAQVHAAIGTGGGTPPVVLHAEDVLRGWRVDVRDEADGRWRSLCARQGDYAALPPAAGQEPLPLELPADEGYVKGPSTTSDPDRPDDHYLHETLFRWTGWSLAVPRPGRTLRERTQPGTGLQSEEIVEPHDMPPAAQGNGLRVRLRPLPGTLPRLRFGQAYRLRARMVDLAGNSLALDDPTLAPEEQATDAVAYGRFEPLDPPALALRHRLSEGESLERMVLRSNHDRSTADYTADIHGALASFYDNPDVSYRAEGERHAVPPKAAQQMCELHGMFDEAIGSGDAARIRQAYAVAGRESGSLMHPVPGAELELVTPAAAGARATVQAGAGDPGAVIAPPEQADPERDRFAAGQYLLHREALVPVPYLPDPACGGLALHGVPGMAALVDGKPLHWLAPGLPGVLIGAGLRAALVAATQQWVLLVDMDADPGDDPGERRAQDWPQDVRSLRLVLAEQPDEVATPPCGPAHTASQAPQWDAQASVLTLFLPKGHVTRLRYASFVHDRMVGHFALPNWHDAAGAAQLRAEALAGANWMLTPWRSLVLVHATQQPVCEPWLEHLSVQRDEGATHADLLARRVHLHGPSTGKFEIVAEWDEWIDDPLADDPAAPGPRRVRHEAQLSEIRLDENHANVFLLQEAVRRQRQFTPVGGQVLEADLQQRPAAPGNRHDFGDTRFRFVRYRLRATTRFREYLPPKLFAQGERITRLGPVNEEDRVRVPTVLGRPLAEDAGAPVLRAEPDAADALAGTVVPASAPPLPPELVYTVPTFRWERPPAQGGVVSSTRHGNGLRVYLDRPWFSSGDGELLGVVLRADGGAFGAIEPELLPFVTQWGQDPLWDATGPRTSARVADFPAAVASEAVSLAERPGSAVHVVGHRVHFDAVRQLWWADIELDPGLAYMPFVRLALVRYQPHALPGARISRVVLDEFAQVLPRRRAVLRRTGATLQLDVRGTVPARGPMRRSNPGGQEESEYADISFIPPPGAQLESGRNRMELVLQTRPQELDSDLAWEDHLLLHSALAEPGRALVPRAEGLHVQRVEEAPLTRRTRSGRTLRFDRLVQRDELPDAGRLLEPAAGATGGPGQRGGDAGDGAGQGAVRGTVTGKVVGKVAGKVAGGVAGSIGRGPIGLPQIDPPVFSLTATLPALPAGRQGRLMLREFERFYTDRTVPEVRAGAPRRRVVVEERLVYAEVFALD